MIEIAESSFDPANSPNHTLSIRFLPDGFCFVVASLTERRPLYFCRIAEAGKSVSQQFLEQFNKLDSLRRKYSEVYFLNDDKHYTLMPSTLFDETDKQTYWEFCTNGKSDGMKITQDELSFCDALLLHSIPEEISQPLTERFPAIRFVHRQSILASQTMVQSKKSGKGAIGIYVGEGEFDIVGVKENLLQIANTYPLRNNEEFLYFTLNVFDQLKFDPYETETLLHGNVNAKSPLLSDLRKYVNNVEIDIRPHVELGKLFAKSDVCEKQTILFDLPTCV